jgi:uncharacterized SAM-binding protein YcdF (DUF218 family)
MTHSILKHNIWKASVVTAIFILIVAIFVFRSGNFLVVNHPERSDVIVVLAGDHNDLRYWRGLQLLREHYGNRMLVDAPVDRIYGHSYAEYAVDFIKQSAGESSNQITICAVTKDSTVEEASDIRPCLAQVQPTPTSVLLVTNNYHTRRALSILRSRLPQYKWSVAAVEDTEMFDTRWWKNREWAKICVYEWEKLLWWKLFESWRN